MNGFLTGYCSRRGADHTVNQDSICLRLLEGGDRCTLVAGVFDGMGGLSNGERISGAAAASLSSWAEKNRAILLSWKEDELRNSLRSMLEDLNGKIRSFCSRDASEAGSTAVILLADRKNFICCNLGDSRAYSLCKSGLFLLSEDHSLAADLVRAGLLAQDQMALFPQKAVLTQALGILEKVTPFFRFGTHSANDCFLLCSDGFYSGLTDDDLTELASVSGGSNEINDALRRAAAKAIAHGVKDDITAILIKTTK